MSTFKEYLEQLKFVDFITNIVESDNTAPSSQASGTAQNKPWSATKDEVIQIWRNLRPDTPVYMTPMKDDDEVSTNPTGGHSSYGEDGVRITGSWQFIASIMARLKEVLQYENPQHKLRVVFRGIDPTRVADPSKQAFAFYVNLEKRKTGKAGRPKNDAPKLDLPELPKAPEAPKPPKPKVLKF